MPFHTPTPSDQTNHTQTNSDAGYNDNDRSSDERIYNQQNPCRHGDILVEQYLSPITSKTTTFSHMTSTNTSNTLASSTWKLETSKSASPFLWSSPLSDVLTDIDVDSNMNDSDSNNNNRNSNNSNKDDIVDINLSGNGNFSENVSGNADPLDFSTMFTGSSSPPTSSQGIFMPGPTDMLPPWNVDSNVNGKGYTTWIVGGNKIIFPQTGGPEQSQEYPNMLHVQAHMAQYAPAGADAQPHSQAALAAAHAHLSSTPLPRLRSSTSTTLTLPGSAFQPIRTVGATLSDRSTATAAQAPSHFARPLHETPSLTMEERAQINCDKNVGNLFGLEPPPQIVEVEQKLIIQARDDGDRAHGHVEARAEAPAQARTRLQKKNITKTTKTAKAIKTEPESAQIEPSSGATRGRKRRSVTLTDAISPTAAVASSVAPLSPTTTSKQRDRNANSCDPRRKTTAIDESKLPPPEEMSKTDRRRQVNRQSAQRARVKRVTELEEARQSVRVMKIEIDELKAQREAETGWRLQVTAKTKADYGLDLLALVPMPVHSPLSSPAILSQGSPIPFNPNVEEETTV